MKPSQSITIFLIIHKIYKIQQKKNDFPLIFKTRSKLVTRNNVEKLSRTFSEALDFSLSDFLE